MSLQARTLPTMVKKNQTDETCSTYFRVSPTHLFLLRPEGECSVTRYPEVSLILATKMNGEWLSKIQQVEGKNFRFCVYLSCYFKEQDPGFYIFWSGKFIQKVLWEENTCEEGICRTKFLNKEMRNSDLLQLINDLR